MIDRDTEIVSRIRSRLVDRIGSDRFETWFGATVQITCPSGSLRVSADCDFRLERLRRGLRSDIECVAREVLGDNASVEFTVSPLDPGQLPTDGQQPHPLPADELSVATPSISLADASPGRTAGPTRRRGRRFATLRSFVVGSANQLAYESAKMVLQQPGEMTPLLVHGPPGVGKTHLLEGIWSAMRSAGGRRVIYLSAEQFTTYFLQALRGGGLPSFRQKYRGVDLLIIDDLQFFRGKQATIQELLHTADALLRESRQLVFAADRGPVELQSLSSELAARIAGGLSCGIQPIDCETRKRIVWRLATARHTKLSEGVVERIAERVQGDARQLTGVLNRLMASQALGHAVTEDLAERVIDELCPTASNLVRLNDIQRVICDEFDIEPEMLKSDSRSRHISHPRMLAMWLARKHTRAALTEISEFFGRRSHSTVVSAQNKVNNWVDRGQQLQCVRRTCKVQDVLSRLEQSLNTG